MRVLLIEDDATMAQSVELMLKSEGLNVYTTDLGEEGLNLAKLYDYDVVLLDTGLPDVPGLEVLSAMRAARVNAPVIVLSAANAVLDSVLVLNAGADDCICKPFDADELVARIRAVVRRARGHAQSTIEVGALQINLNTHEVAVAGRQVHLTSKEYQLLEALVLRRSRMISKEMLLNYLYGGMDEPRPQIIDVFICKLRKKLGGNFIETIWGRGFRFVNKTEGLTT